MKKSSKGNARGSGFKYRPRDSESVQKRAEQQGGQFDSIWKDGIDRWRPKDGENVIRILPPTWEDHDHYGFDIWIHGYVGPDKSTYLCPQKMNNEACPICKAARDAKAAGEDDEAKQLTARRQVAVWIIDRDDENPMPKLFAMSWSMDRDIAALCHNKRTGKVLLIDHPDEGYDISFSRTGKGLNTRYIGMAIDREPSPIADSEDDQEKILDYIQENSIPDLLNFYDTDYLEKVIEGGTDERDEDLDEDEDERPAKKKTARGKSRRDEEEEEDEPRSSRRGRVVGRGEEEPEDEEEEDESASKSRTRSKREEVEEDEVEEEDEEEDEPAPKSRKRSEDEDEPEEEYEEDDEPPAKSPKSRNSRRDEEDEEEEDEPRDRRDRRPPPRSERRTRRASR
jgi:hypothetical protein